MSQKHGTPNGLVSSDWLQGFDPRKIIVQESKASKVGQQGQSRSRNTLACSLAWQGLANSKRDGDFCALGEMAMGNQP